MRLLPLWDSCRTFARPISEKRPDTRHSRGGGIVLQAGLPLQWWQGFLSRREKT